MIIEIEGVDGVGKTTQCELLKEYLQQQGKDVIVVKDLGSTELGRGIRKVLTSGESRPPEVELFSFLACKAQLFSQVIVPFISSNGIVICDRGVGSFVSYFESLGFSRSFLLNAITLAINGLRPKLTLLLDVDIEEAAHRKDKKLEQSKFDLMSNEFFRKQREVFLDLSKEASWVVVDGSLSVEGISALISHHVESVLS